MKAAASVVATATLALLAVVGCSAGSGDAGGPPNASGAASTGSSSTGSSSTGASSTAPASSQLVAYTQCMRSHGVPNFPDPTSQGLPKGDARQFGVSSSRLKAAQAACQQLLPTTESVQQQVQQCETTGDCPRAVVQQALTIMREYARCLRSHGVPNFPDPTVDSGGRPFFNVSGAGLSYQFTHSAQFGAKDAACERLVGGSAGVPVPVR